MDAFTGKSARNMLGERFNADFANSIRMLYGGSARPGISAGLFFQSYIDGGLICGGSLQTDGFF